MYRDHKISFPDADDAVGWRKLALEDRMTGLASQAALDLWVQERYKPAERSYLAVFVDIVDFKSFNDTYGQGAGDELIHNYGSELRALCRLVGDDITDADELRQDPEAEDIFARIGGDEALLCYDLNGLKTKNLLEAIDTIMDRFSSFKVIDTETGEQKKIRAVFTLVTPNHPRTFEEILADLGEQIVALKNYEKKMKLGKALMKSEFEQLQFKV